MKPDFQATKSLFDLPANTIYLDGNSLGPPTKKMSKKVGKFIKQKWAKLLIKGWNEDDWIHKPKSIGNQIAKLIGAEENSVVVGDTLSIKTYQALFAAIQLHPNRRIILTDIGNFPSDLYVAQGLLGSIHPNYKLRLVEPTNILNALSDEVAVLFLTEVDFKTGRKHDMQRITEKAKKLGIITIWDLAHSTGVIPIHLKKFNVDFAVGCTYKYLNGGPGSPGFLYVARAHQNRIENPIKGWLGHSSPFSFESQYRGASGINKMQIGTPPIISSRALEISLKIFDEIEISHIRKKSIELTELFIDRINKNCPALELVSPREARFRGAHLAYRFEEGYAVIQCLIESGVIGDFRAPNLMRFGFNPLFIDKNDVLKASAILTDIVTKQKWNRKDLKYKSYVT